MNVLITPLLWLRNEKVGVTCVSFPCKDISYYCCIEVEGKQGEIIARLKSLFSPETGRFDE